MSAAGKGKPRPWLRGRKRPNHSAKMKLYWKNHELREEARKRGLAMAADQEWLLKIAKAVSGELNPMWKGGIAGQKYAPGFSRNLKAKIRERDEFKCQLCGTPEDELGYRLSVHHSDYDKSNHDELNLFAVCKRCNSLVNTNREIWVGYFYALSRRRELGQDVSGLIDRKVISQRKDAVFVSHYGDEGIDDIKALFSWLSR